MPNNYLITGYHGTPHVTAHNDRALHAAIFGVGYYVLVVGEELATEYTGNNTVRMHDGLLSDRGALAGIPAGQYIDFTVDAAASGKVRNDIIAFQYERNSSTQIESGSFVLIKGTEVSSNPADPTLTRGNLLTGSPTLEQMPLWRIPVSGATVGTPVKLFETIGVKGHAHYAHDVYFPDNQTLQQKFAAGTIGGGGSGGKPVASIDVSIANGDYYITEVFTDGTQSTIRINSDTSGNPVSLVINGSSYIPISWNSGGSSGSDSGDLSGSGGGSSDVMG